MAELQLEEPGAALDLAGPPHDQNDAPAPPPARRATLRFPGGFRGGLALSGPAGALPRPRVVFDGTRPRRPWDRYSCLTLSLFLGGGGLLAALLFGAAFLPLGSPAQLGCGLLCGGLGALLLRSRRQAAPAEDEAPAQRATRVALETVLLLGTLIFGVVVLCYCAAPYAHWAYRKRPTQAAASLVAAVFGGPALAYPTLRSVCPPGAWRHVLACLLSCWLVLAAVGYATLRWAAPAAPPEGPAACPWAVLALGRITGHADFSCP